MARAFKSKVVNGKIRAAVRGIRGQGQRGVLFPWNLYFKTGQPVMDILRDKHPAICNPDLSYPKGSSFEDYLENPDVVPLDISK